MDKLINFISTNLTPICTLLATIIGGLISYFSASSAENRKVKNALRKEKLVDILIPYCTCIENTIELANTIYDEEFQLSIDDFFMELEKPLQYLKAEKRAYLSFEQKKKLELYNELLINLRLTLESDYTNTYIKYVHWLDPQLSKFPNLKNPMNIRMSFDEIGIRRLYLSIIRNSKCSLINRLKHIDYIKNDDPENYRHTSVNITTEDKDSYGAVAAGIIDFDEIEKEEDRLVCEFLDYIADIRDIEFLDECISNSASSFNMIGLTDLLNEINNDIIAEIDRITK